MGLTNQSTGLGALNEMFQVRLESPEDIVIALAGNPNTGKSTVFNGLTGLNQHTGNWPGKTVTNAQGNYTHQNKRFVLVDLPGTYSLLANSVEEEVARDFICFGKPGATVVITDATCLERNLNLVLQITEMTQNVVVCVNLLDEAKRKKIDIDLDRLSRELPVPVFGTNARNGEGLDELKQAVYKVTKGDITPNPVKVNYNKVIQEALFELKAEIENIVDGNINSRWTALRLLDGDKTILEAIDHFLGFNLLDNQGVVQKLEQAQRVLKEKGMDPDILRDELVSSLVRKAEELAGGVITHHNKNYNQLDRRIDNVLTSKLFGIPIMVGLLGIVFWLTIQGANYPSEMLAKAFFAIEDQLTALFVSARIPEWIHGIVVLGVYRTLAWVVSVMLPPMAIFFPLFTSTLENLTKLAMIYIIKIRIVPINKY